MLDRLVDLIKRYPSGDNCQPWDFSFDNYSIKITYNKKRDEHFLNHSGFIFYFGKGFLLQTIEDVTQEFCSCFNIIDSGEIIEINNIELKENNDYSKSLHAKRFSDRRPYDEPIGEELIVSILSGKRNLKLSSDFSGDFRKHTGKSDKIIWQRLEALVCFMRWLILDKNEYNKNKEGLLYSQVGLSSVDLPLFKLIKKFPAFFSKLFSTPLFIVLKIKLDRFYKNTTFMAYSIDELNGDEIIKVSRKILQDWLLLNQHDISYQPMNISVLPYADEAFRDQGDKHHEIFQLFQKEFNLSGKVVWLARLGRCRKPYDLPESLRR